MTELRKRMIRDMQVRNFSPATQKGYLRAVTYLARYYNCSPDKISTDKVHDYLAYLLIERKVAVGTYHAIITGLRFFYTVTLKFDKEKVPIPSVKKVTRLPEVLCIEEVERLFNAADYPKQRTLLMTVYSAGLRVSEAVNLKVTDIQSDRMSLRVNQGKGGKGRYTLLSERLLQELRAYWKIKHPPVWLFPGRSLHKPMTTRIAQYYYEKAAEKAGIKKLGGIHTLRHCFATHLLESGVDIRTIQILMGHSSILSTVCYLQLTSKSLQGTKSPLDLLPKPNIKHSQ
jgi:site-specific recombinase XerD